jgi:adenine-specific DNA methylase
MNFIACETAQKLRGGYYTRPDVAAFLSQWVLEIKPRRVLEPACGDGVFFESLAGLTPASVTSVLGCEIDAAEAGKARERARKLTGAAVKIHAGDFLSWFLSRPSSAPLFDAVLGNPPFIRYQYLDDRLQALAETIFRNLGLPFTRHTNAWVPFVLASLALLRPGGRLAMVVPAELLHVLHARSLRRFLLEQCARILVIDPIDLWFDGTLQGVVLLLAEKRPGPGRGLAEIAILGVQDRQALAKNAGAHLAGADCLPGAVLNGKWTLGLLSRSERLLLERLEAHPQIRRFQEVARVDVGIVTGANHFFLVPDAIVQRYSLESWAHPMFGRSEHVRGVIYDAARHRENRRRGLPANFLWFGARRLAELPGPTRRYLREGEKQGLHWRYKCRVRTPWYAVPSVYAAPVSMLKRCHHFPRLVLNRAKAFSTDTAYRITPTRGTDSGLVLTFVNSLTALSSELEGRHYGGGVLELVPSEIERVLLPAAPGSSAALTALDQAVQKGLPPDVLLTRQDQVVLQPLGIGKSDCEELLSAWHRLRARRQRSRNSVENVISGSSARVALT